jgi:hypothetical protein
LTVRRYACGTEEKGDDREALTEVVAHSAESNKELREMTSTSTTFEYACTDEMPTAYFDN